MLNMLQQQYDWIRLARQNLFTFLEELPPQVLGRLPEDAYAIASVHSCGDA